MAAAARALAKAADGLPPGEPVTFDLYTWEDDGESTRALSAAALAETLAPVLAARPEQVVVAWAAPVRRTTSARCGT